MTSEAQRRANAKQDATRKRVALWLEPDEQKALEKVMRKQRLPSRIDALRWLIARALPPQHKAD
jgi:hypothetical protein